jgi:Xaa-Pro aminopeptidase
VAPRIDLPMEQGMALALEPKAYLPGIGPVGVENTYFIVKDGCHRLCQVDSSIRSLSS